VSEHSWGAQRRAHDGYRGWITQRQHRDAEREGGVEGGRNRAPCHTLARWGKSKCRRWGASNLTAAGIDSFIATGGGTGD